MLRPLTPEDLDAYVRLRRASFRSDPLSFEQPADVVIDPAVALDELDGGPERYVLGCFEEDVLVGMVGFTRYEGPKRRHRAYLWGVYLQPACRGKGLARLMLETVVKRARELEGLERIILTVSHRADAALKIYAALGFVEFGREAGAARTGTEEMDEVYLLLDL